MESVHQQISQCLKETIGKYYIFEEEELINIIDKTQCVRLLVPALD